MNKIVCNVEPGMALQSVLYYKNDVLQNTEQVAFSDLAPYLINACYQENCYNLHLVGVWSFLQGLYEEILSEEVAQYNTNKIQIEVN